MRGFELLASRVKSKYTVSCVTAYRSAVERSAYSPSNLTNAVFIL